MKLNQRWQQLKYRHIVGMIGLVYGILTLLLFHNSKYLPDLLAYPIIILYVNFWFEGGLLSYILISTWVGYSIGRIIEKIKKK